MANRRCAHYPIPSPWSDFTGGGLYRVLARRMWGYADAQARHLFRDLIDIPGDVTITHDEIRVRFHRRAHLPTLLASGLLDTPVAVPWWEGRRLRVTS